MELSFLHTMLPPKLPSVDLHGALPTIVVFNSTLFLVREFTSQQMKGSNGSVLMESTCLTGFPTVLKQPARQNDGNGLLKTQLRCQLGGNALQS